MIFVTVGTQLPFPRLIDAMNAFAAANDEKVIAQVGPEPGDWPHLEVCETLAPAAFEANFREARAIVAHAGVGSILSAKRFGRPLIILPRRHALGEHRNDHQVATAKAVEAVKGVYVAWEADDLPGLLAQPDLETADDAESATRAALIDRLKSFIDAA